MRAYLPRVHPPPSSYAARRSLERNKSFPSLPWVVRFLSFFLCLRRGRSIARSLPSGSADRKAKNSQARTLGHQRGRVSWVDAGQKRTDARASDTQTLKLTRHSASWAARAGRQATPHPARCTRHVGQKQPGEHLWRRRCTGPPRDVRDVERTEGGEIPGVVERNGPCARHHLREKRGRTGRGMSHARQRPRVC